MCFSEAHQTRPGHHCVAIDAIIQMACELVETLKSDARQLKRRRSRILHVWSVLADRKQKYEAQLKAVDYDDRTATDAFQVRIVIHQERRRGNDFFIGRAGSSLSLPFVSPFPFFYSPYPPRTLEVDRNSPILSFPSPSLPSPSLPSGSLSYIICHSFPLPKK